VNSMNWPEQKGAKSFLALYHNNKDGTFTNVTGQARLAVEMYGIGVAVGDYDNDGNDDIYITCVGPNHLFRNLGGGKFVDVTARAGVGDPGFSTSAVWFDYDNDGKLDLFVGNYVEWSVEKDIYCSLDNKNKSYCTPQSYKGQSATLYHNRGNGTFENVTKKAGVEDPSGKTLGIALLDYDSDGWLDLFVANDTEPNKLYHNNKNGTFTDEGIAAGVAFSAAGTARAGMGIDAADYDGDGRIDLVITNLDFQMHTLSHGLDRLLFANATLESGIGLPTLPFVGFGVSFLDFDNDAQLDIALVNGHVLDNAPRFRSGATYAQRKLLFRNTTLRRFAEVGRSTGTAFSALKVGRGLAVGDVDNDGDLDLLVTNNGQAAELLRNDGGNRGNALVLRLVGSRANRDAIGARVRVTTGSRTQRRDVKAGSSYLSQSDVRVHVGLGTAAMADLVEVKWPDGRVETIRNVQANQLITIREGEGLVDRTPLAR